METILSTIVSCDGSKCHDPDVQICKFGKL